MKSTNSILAGYGTTIFTEMSALAEAHGAINLGQGFPDEEPPEALRRVAADALMQQSNQYPPMLGLPCLRQAVAEHDRRFYGLDIDWRTEVMVTSGATEALADAFLALVEPGDEVILIEPCYDSYAPMARRAGAAIRTVRLQPPDWSIPWAALSAAVGPRTKLLVINSPHNPTGKVLSADDLSHLARFVETHDLIAVCDEVYEHLTFDGALHRPLMALPGMRDRCIRIGSTGKTFSATGWKVGYLVAAPPLLQAVAKAHQFVTFTTPPNLQVAAAAGLGLGDDFFTGLRQTMGDKRRRLGDGLTALGFAVLPTQGSYFLSVDIRSAGYEGNDVDFCRALTTDHGVTAVPVSAFYAGEAEHRFARFCFCKRDSVLDAAIDRLRRSFTRT